MLAAHTSRDVIEGEGCKRHKRRYKDGHEDEDIAACLTDAANAFALCDFGQGGDDNAKAIRRDQASIHSKAQSGRNAARQYDRFVE